MKITLRKLLYLIAFISFTLGAKAQNVAIPDTLRLSIGVDAINPEGGFSNSFVFGAGVSLQVDAPITEKLYFTGNVGYDHYFPNNNVSTNPLGIENVTPPSMETAPVKIGLKYFLIRGFYLQAEAGETLLLNKSTVYALDGSGLTYGGGMGIVFKLHHKNYIDGGFRYERQQSFYGDGGYNSFIGARVAYAFNLK